MNNHSSGIYNGAAFLCDKIEVKAIVGGGEVSRPSKYEELLKEGLLTRVKGWAMDGLTNEQIAANIGIDVSTLYIWKNKHKEFFNVLKKTKELADREIENALFETAKGFYYTEETVTNTGEVVEVRKYHKPNTTAQIFWLKNRKVNEWRDKQEIQSDVNNTVTIVDNIGNEDE